MVGRFTARRTAAPELVPAMDEASPALEGVSWTVFPDAGTEPVAAQTANPLLSDKLLDAKVRLHRRLIEEINLQALEKLPEDQIRAHVQQLNTSWSSAWRSTNRSSTTSFPRFSTR
jgi:pilus assembly protein CpaF